MLRNNLKTAVMLGGLGGLIVLAGSLIGGRSGLVIGLVLGLLMVGGSYWFSDKLAVRAAGARPVEPGEIPWLEQTIALLAQRGGIPTPRLYISPNLQPNAFATGRSPRQAVVCVTDGLLRVLDRDEVAGVVATELGHVKHRDILISSVAATLGAAITGLARFGFFFGGRRDDEDSSPVGGLLFLILAPIAALLIQMAISRTREYSADAAAARYTGSPLGLVNALRKLDNWARRIPMEASPAMSHLYIFPPLSGGLAQLFSTHPSTEKRIAALLDRRG